MKTNRKIKIIIPLLIICVSGILSCSKNDDEVLDINQYSKNGCVSEFSNINVSLSHQYLRGDSITCLTFDTKEDYFGFLEIFADAEEAELDAFENMIGFTSMRNSLLEEEREEIGFEDDVLATLVNSYRQIQIGDSLFTLNIEDGCVVIDNLVDESQSVVSIDEEVYNEEATQSYNSDEDENENELLSSKCKLPSTYYPLDDSVLCKVKYCRAAIYFSLKAVMREPAYLFPRTDYSYKYLNVYEGSYTLNKRRASQTFFSSYSIIGYERKYKHVVYRGFKGLKQFELAAYFYVYQLPPRDEAVALLSIHRNI